MLKVTIISLLIIVMFGCGDFLVDVHTDRDWFILESDNIILHIRPKGHPHHPRLTESDLIAILDNKNYFYNLILDTLGLQFSDKILIYLLRHDEAFEITDGQGRGVAMPDVLTYYWIYKGYPVSHPAGRKVYAGGAHEIVHIITHQVLGTTGTIALSEGYAVALDGRSGQRERYSGGMRYIPLVDAMKEYYEEGKVIMPGRLLREWDFTSRHYTNAGFFTMFLFDTYGIELVNRLFPVPGTDFRQKFFDLTGIGFEEMEQLYLSYCSDTFEDNGSD